MSEETEQSAKAAIKESRELLRKLEEAGATYPESASRVISRLSRYVGNYPIRNLAVEVCDQMFTQTMDKALKEDNCPEDVKEMGKLTFCAALPRLAGADNIRDFIACVTHGMAMGIIPGNEGTRLLYAAQVAHTVRTKRPKKRNKSSHTNTHASPATTKESTS
jgi:hypothetical protein